MERTLNTSHNVSNKKLFASKVDFFDFVTNPNCPKRVATNCFKIKFKKFLCSISFLYAMAC